MAYLYLSAAHKSSGKTTVSVGLAAALNRRGLKVRTFKKGPDYIDPLWLQKATGSPCYNLDFNTQSHDEIKQMFARHLAGADIGLIEGNKGLYDGVALDGHDSNAALAVLLGAPVVLVIDVTGITRGIAPLLMGYSAFDAEVNIAGVIFNKVAGSRQESKLRASVQQYTDLEVAGSIPRNDSLLAPERHLGLLPPDESDRAGERISELADIIENSVDIDHLLEISRKATLPVVTAMRRTTGQNDPKVRIGIARDSAFGFYYADDLDALREAGADLLFFNSLKDAVLPDVDGVFLGGGFPETHMPALEANAGLRADIRQKARNGLPVYAECGGMMYLAERIEWNGESADMVGFIPGVVQMHDKPRGRGLVRLKETGHGKWSKALRDGEPAILTAHEFHYASLTGLPEDTLFAHEVLRGYGIDGAHDGIVRNNVQAGFCHHRTTAGNDWAVRFVDFVRRCKKR